MKRNLALFVIYFLLGFVAVAQNTTVSGTIVDSDSTTWANGSWKVQFINPNGAAPKYCTGGASIGALSYSGTLDSTGSFTQVLPDNTQVCPQGTSWQFTFCSYTSAPCSQINALTISGTTFNISSYATLNITAPRIKLGNIAGIYAYTDGEMINQNPGNLYWNVTTHAARQWQCSSPTSCTWGGLVSSTWNGGNLANPIIFPTDYLPAGLIDCKGYNFGATGNGTTDDTAAVQNCFNYAQAHNTGVHLSAGTYLITAPLNATTTIYTNGFAIYGDGETATIILHHFTSPGPVIDLGGQSLGGVFDLAIRPYGNSNASSAATAGILVSSGTLVSGALISPVLSNIIVKAGAAANDCAVLSVAADQTAWENDYFVSDGGALSIGQTTGLCTGVTSTFYTMPTSTNYTYGSLKDMVLIGTQAPALSYTGSIGELNVYSSFMALGPSGSETIAPEVLEVMNNAAGGPYTNRLNMYGTNMEQYNPISGATNCINFDTISNNSIIQGDFNCDTADSSAGATVFNFSSTGGLISGDINISGFGKYLMNFTNGSQLYYTTVKDGATGGTILFNNPPTLGANNIFYKAGAVTAASILNQLSSLQSSTVCTVANGCINSSLNSNGGAQVSGTLNAAAINVTGSGFSTGSYINYAPNNANLLGGAGGGTSWTVQNQSTGTQTYTTGVAGPSGWGNTATTVTTTGTYFQLQDEAGGTYTAVPANTAWAASVWIKGNAGGESVQFGGPGFGGATFTLPDAAWHLYCLSGNSGATNLGNIFGLAMNGAETVSWVGMTSAPGSCAVFVPPGIIIAATQVITPQTITVGALNLTTTGTSGAATYNGGTLNIPNYAASTFTPGGDLGGTSTTQEVIGLLTHALPTLATGYLGWNGTAWAFSASTGMVWPTCANGIPYYAGSSAWGASCYNTSNVIPANFLATIPNTQISGLGALATAAYPGAGIPNSTGSGWGTSYSATNNIPANFISTLNQNTTGQAGTALALAATPSNCIANGEFAQGIAANGAASCDTNLDDGHTTANTLTYAGSAGIAAKGFTGTGTGPAHVQIPAVTFATLTGTYTCNTGNTGQIASVSDSTTQTWGATVTGGSTLYALVVCDGTNWTVVGK